MEDRGMTRILVLADAQPGRHALTIQSPWSAPVNVAFPYAPKSSDYQFFGISFLSAKRSKSTSGEAPRNQAQSLVALMDPSARGQIDVLDGDFRRHRLKIEMRARDEQVATILDICRSILPGNARGGEGILTTWWEVLQWLRLQSRNEVDEEWAALNISLMSMAVMFLDDSGTPRSSTTPARTSRSSKTAPASVGPASFRDMLRQESSRGSSLPIWMNTPAWDWVELQLERRAMALGSRPENAKSSLDRRRGHAVKTPSDPSPTMKNSLMLDYVAMTRQFLASESGERSVGSRGFLPTAQSKDPEIRRTALATVVVGLHLYREELKLNITGSDSDRAGAGRLTPLLGQLTGWLGWDAWSWKHPGYYSTEEVGMQQWLFDEGREHQTEKSLSLTAQAPFLTLVDIVGARSPEIDADGRSSSEDYLKGFTPRTEQILELFAHIAVKIRSPADIVQKMVDLGFDIQLVDALPEGLAVPLREAIAACREYPPTHWAEKALRLIGRDDLQRLLAAEPGDRGSVKPKRTPTGGSVRDVSRICAAAFEAEGLGSVDAVADHDRQAITRLIFRDDRRFEDAARLVDSTVPSVARCELEPDWSDTDLLNAQKSLVLSVVSRTLSMPAGRGLLFFGGRLPLLTETFPIPGFNLSCLMKPSNTTVSAEKHAYTEEKVSWAFFHSGVAAGLTISRKAKGIDTSWITFNRADELNNRHAGFLLALGLNGHLKTLARWIAFKYLTPKHTMTSIGLLLGLSASYLGTMDSLLTRLISVHVTCLLPPGSAELNLSPLTQTAGLLAAGLLYCGTQHRRMSEVMLSEIERVDDDEISAPMDALRDEGYRLAAGFALGFINVGKGEDLKGLHDMQLVRRLLTLAVGVKEVDINHVLDKAMAGATIAIALIFMKTHNGPLARKLDVPESSAQFDYVRPDMFLLRTVAKHLILWNEIQASYAWLKRNIPHEYRERMKWRSITVLTSQDLPMFNIVAGLCFAIGLRFAGSGNEEVRDLLRFFLDHFMRLTRLPAVNYDQKLTRSAVRNCQDLLALSAATVMAGSGDLDIFRRLRSLHGRTDVETPYGSHLTTHMAIGLLFLGGGSHTVGTSDLAVASLLCAFYPQYPISVHDNSSHLQAFRHLCVLAVEPRCVVPRDVDSLQPIPASIEVRLRSGAVQHRAAPCLLPELTEIATIASTSADHWPVTLDFALRPAHVAAFTRHQSIYLRERAAHEQHPSSSGLLAAREATDTDTAQHPFEWLLHHACFDGLDAADRDLVLPRPSLSDLLSMDPDAAALSATAAAPHHVSESTVVDARLLLEHVYLAGARADRLRNLRLLFAYADRVQREGLSLRWLRQDVVDALRTAVWKRLAEDDDE
ncbi:MAG: Anaphase-promoting complex subunit 1 [Phylliscum demangeonii]|nr:MAG: Anaphase-promoting complex subunit 1 [Phylliscum demangeonii]